MRRCRAVTILLLVTLGGALAAPAQQRKKPPADAPGGVGPAQAADSVFGLLKDGLEGHIKRLFMSAFDQDMPGYDQFDDQIESLFRAVQIFRVQFRVLQSQMLDRSGVLLVQVDLDESGAAAPRRASEEVKLNLVLTRKGWRIADLEPRTLFLPPR